VVNPLEMRLRKPLKLRFRNCSLSEFTTQPSLCQTAPDVLGVARFCMLGGGVQKPVMPYLSIRCTGRGREEAVVGERRIREDGIFLAR